MKSRIIIIVFLFIGINTYAQKKEVSDTTKQKTQNNLVNDTDKQNQADKTDNQVKLDTKISPGASGVKRSISFKFSTILTDSDPGNGIFRFNDNAISKVNYIYLDDIDLSEEDQTRWYSTWDDTTGATGRGQLTLVENEGRNIIVLDVTGVFVDDTGFWKIPVEYVSGGLPADGSTYYYIFNRIAHKKKQETPENQVTQVVPEVPIISQVTQEVPVTPQVAPEVPVIQVAQEVPVTQVAPEVPVIQVAQEVPVTQVAPEVPVIQVAQEVPVTQIVPEVPVIQVAQEVPVTQVVPEVPVIQVAQEVPVTQVVPEVPVIQVAQEVPVTQVVPEVPVIQVAQEVQVTPQVTQEIPVTPQVTQEIPDIQVAQEVTVTPQVTREVPVTPQVTQEVTVTPQVTQEVTVTPQVTQAAQGNQTTQRNQSGQEKQDTQVVQSTQKTPSSQPAQVPRYNQAVSTQNNYGTTAVNHKKCYRGIIEIGYALGIGDYGINNFRFNFINGFKLCPSTSLGLGIGYRRYFDKLEDHPDRNLVSSKVQIPVFLDLRTTFTTRKVTPYLALGLGGSSGYSSTGTTKEGFYFSPSGGIWFNISDRFAVFTGIAYEMQKLEYSYVSDDSHFKKSTSSVSLNIGIAF
jgi:hypothetical protein